MNRPDPLDDARALIARFPAPDSEARRSTADRLSRGGESLGRLGDLALWAAGWRGAPPRIERPIFCLYAASHEGRGEPGAARSKLDALAAGGGAVPALARAQGAGVEAFDLAVDRPAPDMAVLPAMSGRECAATLAFGMEAVAKRPDLVILGDLASGGERACAALALALIGGQAADWAGPEDASWVEAAAGRARAASGDDPLALLTELGGREVAASVGALVAARTQGVMVILDGFAAAAAAAVLQRLAPEALDHVRAAEAPAHAGHARLLQTMGVEPVLASSLDAGPGLAGAAALSLLRMACQAVAAD